MGVPVVVTVNCREGGTWYEGQETKEIKVMPNPFTNELTVAGLEFKAGDRLELINVLGEIVLTQTIFASRECCKLQTENLSPGVYFLQIATQAEKKTVKVVKQ